MTRMRAAVVPAALAAALALAGAGCGGQAPAASAPRPANSSGAAGTGRVAVRRPVSHARAPAGVHREGCPDPESFPSEVLLASRLPVAPSALRLITVTYRGFDHKVHTGQLVVNAAVTGKLILVFRTLFTMGYPIRRMVPVDAYHGSDFASIQADNTSAFNCRDATGSSSWSEHAYGLAVDLDPCENPYVAADGYEAHPRCRVYVDRSLHDPGIIHAGDKVVRAFASVGWGWGGTWQGARDYQHFSANGR